MLNNKLSPQEKEILYKIIIIHKPHLLPLLDLPSNVLLTAEQREELREAVAEELLLCELDENDQPTPRGLLLEELIDRLWYLSEDGQ